VTGPYDSRARRARHGAAVVLFVVLLTMLLGLVALAVDVGYMMLTRTQLQVAADAAAMAGAASMAGTMEQVVAAARRYAGYHYAGGHQVALTSSDVQLGLWDSATRRFTPSESPGNAVKVTARHDGSAGGQAPLFFGRIFSRTSFPANASAVAVANPRDIAFVVDLSGSMNDDTEPCWATGQINTAFGSAGYGAIGDQLMQQLYSDLGFGAFPGTLEHLGQYWGLPQDEYAYADLTKNNGPLDRPSVPAKYRICATDSERVRKVKAYSAIIDVQIARIMPKAGPAPDSSTNYGYWEKYLDYVMTPVSITPRRAPAASPPPSSGPRSPPGPAVPSPSPPPRAPLGWLAPHSSNPWHEVWPAAWQFPCLASLPEGDASAGELAMAPGGLERDILVQSLAAVARGTPPDHRGPLPPSQDGDRITDFNNPNTSTFPSANRSLPSSYRDRIGYRTYVQFMLDFGRDLKPDDAQLSPLSPRSPLCPWHWETTAGGTFRFPPRTQPVHAARRALIAAMQVVQERNASIGDPKQRDWVSVVSFDTLTGGGPVLQQPLTADYEAAMQACTALEACGDRGATTATDAGLNTARDHIKAKSQGGQGRETTNKVVVLLTDGAPNLYVTGRAEIDTFIADNPKPEFYPSGAYWYDAALVQSLKMQKAHWFVFPVGIGLGCDYGFTDRMSRLGGTADKNGRGSRGSGNPAEYEQRLAEIFSRIITNPRVRLVQ